MKETDILNARLRYRGGNAEGRIIQGKLDSLKKALLYSYQACTAVLEDGREFRCLMNPSRTKADYDVKDLSIPFEDVPLKNNLIERVENNSDYIKNENFESQEPPFNKYEKIGVKCGDTITWKETNTKWLVLLRFLEEDAYFRGECYRCDQYIEIKGKKYWVYIRGPVETSTQWNQKGGILWNNLNYSLVMYIKKDEETEAFFHRFQTLDIIDGNTDKLENLENLGDNVEITGPKKKWRVAAIDHYYNDGIIEVMLDEEFNNEIEDAVNEEKKLKEENQQPIEDLNEIKGESRVEGYTTYEYSIGISGGRWYTDLPEAQVKSSNDSSVVLSINTGKAGHFTLYYKVNGDIYSKTIEVLPF